MSGQRPTDELEIEKVFVDFWADIVLDAKGEIDPAKVKAELHDYHLVLENVPAVYCHITGNRMSKAHYRAADVIREADEYHERSCGYDAGWLAAEAAEEESLRRHRTELDRVRGELSKALQRTDEGFDQCEDLCVICSARYASLHDAALKLLAITAPRAPLPGEKQP